MINYARSGGTLLNRCLAAMPEMVVISEVNPLGGGWGTAGAASPVTIADQAKMYYNIKINKGCYESEAIQLHKVCSDLGKTLIIRDWSFINFVPYQENQFNPPNKLLALENLESIITVRPFALVRDAIDVWISRKTPPPMKFFSEYAHFVNAILEKRMPIFKFEDLCDNSEKFMKSLCILTGIPFSDKYRDYAKIKNVHGDVQDRSFSKGTTAIKPQLRQYICPWSVSELHACKIAAQVNQQLGYPVNYKGKTRETFYGYIYRRIKKLPYQIYKWTLKE